MSRIRTVMARSVYDARGQPLVEVEVHTTTGAIGGALAQRPCPADVSGTDPLQTIRRRVSKALAHVDPTDQAAIDHRLGELTHSSEAALPRELTWAVSAAALRVGAAERDIFVYEHLADLGGGAPTGGWRIPRVMLDIWSSPTPAAAVTSREGDQWLTGLAIMSLARTGPRAAMESVVTVATRAVRRPALKRTDTRWAEPAEPLPPGEPIYTDRERLDQAVAAITAAGYRPGVDIGLVATVGACPIIADVSVSLWAEAAAERLIMWTEDYPLVAVMLPHESLGGGALHTLQTVWKMLPTRVGRRCQWVSPPRWDAPSLGLTDQALAPETSPLTPGDFGATAIRLGLGGMTTVSELLAEVFTARTANRSVILAVPPGGTEDVIASHLALGLAVEHYHLPCLSGAEVTAKLNEWLRIQDRLGPQAVLCRFETTGAAVFETPSPPSGVAGATVAPSRSRSLSSMDTPGDDAPPDDDGSVRISWMAPRPKMLRVLAASLQLAFSDEFDLIRRGFALRLVGELFGPGGAPRELVTLLDRLAEMPVDIQLRQTARHVANTIRPEGKP